MNKKHVEILVRGVDNWNTWREKNPHVVVDLINADLRDVDLHGADLHDVNITGANLYHASMSHNSMSHANLRAVDLTGAFLTSANLRSANLCNTSLVDADLTAADLTGAFLTEADLTDADLIEANLSGADLTEANLCNANLHDADLFGANLDSTNLNGANISGVKGLLPQKEWMNITFKKDDEGYIVYKAFNAFYSNPNHWIFEPGSFITEEVNFDRCTECGCGVNFANLEWLEKNTHCSGIWECRLLFEDLMDLCVPFNTDGKARCSRLKLMRDLEGNNVI